MTSFDTLESGLEGSRPIEIYNFALGAEEFFYTSSEDEITVDSDVYAPEAIRRNSIVQGRDERNRQLEIRLPSDNAFAEKWKTRPPGLPGSVSVIRLQRDEVPTFTTRTLVFKGMVRAAQYPGDGLEAIIGVSSLEAVSQRPVPRFTFQSQCNHYLYDTGCGVDADLHKFTGTVSVVSGSTITVPGAGAFSTNFPAGYVKPTAQSDFRLIVAQSTDVFTLNIPFETSPLGQIIDCFKGCDHLIDGDCDTEFNNVIDFGGFPFVPTRNIFTTGIPEGGGL